MLDDTTDIEDRNTVGESDRLVDVVGDDDDGLVNALLQCEQFILETFANDRINRAIGLIHQQDRRIGCQSACHPDALLLTTR